MIYEVAEIAVKAGQEIDFEKGSSKRLRFSFVQKAVTAFHSTGSWRTSPCTVSS